MERRHGDDAESDAPRSYCVFERDRALPRPKRRSPLMVEAATPSRFARNVVAISVALASAAMAWWFGDW